MSHKETHKLKKILKSTIYPILLAIYSLMLINQGVTMTDTGYNFGNYIHFDSLDNMWKFSTYLASATGSFFSKLPFGSTMLGLNLYTGLVKAAIAVLIYYICTYTLKMNSLLVFLAELMALGYCWCPTALLYNYLTYLLFSLGAIFLVIATQKNANKFYILAGICLGLNVLVRLPNIAEVALILAVWFSCFIRKEKFVSCLQKTGLCILGFVIGFLSIFSYICIRYGIHSYIEGIRQILSMPSEAGGYSLKAMIVGDIMSYINNSKWVFLGLAIILLGTVLYCIFPKKYILGKRIVYVAANILLIYVFKAKGMFRFIYYAYDSIYYVSVFFLIISGLLGLYVMFFGKEDYTHRTYAIVVGIVILITPLGSNNFLLSAINNIFIVTPFVFDTIQRIVKSRDTIGKKELISLEPLKITLSLMTLFCFIQGFLFGAIFTFRDGIDGSKRDTKIESIPALRNMYTREANARSLEEIYDFLQDNNLVGADTILYYNVPGLSFCMNLNPILSTSWPDLDSFSTSKFESELHDVKARIASNSKPLLIMGCPLDNSSRKLEILCDFADDLNYKLIFSNEICYIYY